MATHSDPTPVTPSTVDADELTGIYGFFRRHQKKLLYTAGLFTLLTFSVTGPMTRAFSSLFGSDRKMPTIEVGGQRVSLTVEDYRYGEVVANHLGGLPPVIPRLQAGPGGKSGLSEVLATLRRAAITDKIDVSMKEVDLAIAKAREGTSVVSDSQLALQRGFASLAEFREATREALRIGNYVRLQTLGLDTSEAMAVQRLLDGEERVTFRVAKFDEKAYEDQLKTGTKPTYEELTAWLDAKTDAEKMRLGVYDLNRVELRFGGLMLDQFDSAEWAIVALANLTIGDDQLKATYDQEKERFKVEGSEDYKPFEDAAVKDTLTRIVQSEQVMNYLLGKLREQVAATQKEPNEDLMRCRTEESTAQQSVATLEAKLKDNPEDAAVKDELQKAKDALEAKKAAVTAADAKVKTARESFDFPAAFFELTAGRKGFVQRSFHGVRTAEQLKDLTDLGFGKWPQATEATGLGNKGDLSRRPGRTANAIVLYQATDVLVRPLKAKEDLQPLLEGAYFTEKAKNEGEAKQKLMTEALLRLAKAKMPEKVAEIEGKKAERIEKLVTDWETATNKGIAEAEKTLAPLAVGTQAQIDWQRKLDTLRAELGRKDAKRTAFEAEVGKAIETEIGDEAKKHHGEVLDAAAAEAGFTVADTAPLWRKLKNRPRFAEQYDKATAFVFRNHDEMKVDESTGVVQDQADRLWLVAVCKKVEPLTLDDLTRREFEGGVSGAGSLTYATAQAYQAYNTAFTREAIEARYSLQRPVGSQEVQ